MKERVRAVVLIAVSVIAIAGIFWFASRYGGGEMSQGSDPQIICQPQSAPPQEQQCFWTAHWHFDIRVVDRQGQKVKLSFEQGGLEETHTHSDRNTLHWHRLIPADPETKEVTDWSELMVREIPEDLGLNFGGEHRFFVNGEEVPGDYILKDGDSVEIRYE